MSRSLSLSIVCCLMLTLGWAQTGRKLQPNASIELIIKNAPAQMFKIGVSNQDYRYDNIDSIMLGQNGTTDSLYYDIVVTGMECHINLGFLRRKLNYFTPILSPGNHMKVVIDVNKPDDIVYTGSEHTVEYYAYQKENLGILGKHPDGPFSTYNRALIAGSADSLIIRPKLDSIKCLQAASVRNTIFKTNSPYLLIYLLSGLSNWPVNLTATEYDLLRAKFAKDKPTLMQIDITQRIQNNAVLQKPKPANHTYLLNFSLPDINGKQVHLKQFKGKYVLVDFWASWCGPCRKESPYLKKALQQFGKHNFVILSVSIDEKPANWKKAISDDGTTAFVHLIDTRGWKSPVTAQYNIHAIPSNFLLGPDGVVIEKDLRGENLLLYLTPLIGKGDITR